MSGLRERPEKKIKYEKKKLEYIRQINQIVYALPSGLRSKTFKIYASCIMQTVFVLPSKHEISKGIYELKTKTEYN
jgi:hypothetical protein